MAVVQVVLLYELETCMLTPYIKRLLGGFHHRVDLSIMGRQPRRGRYGGWLYPPLAEAMAEAGLQEVETHVSRRQNTVAQFIATGTIMDLCLAAERRLGSYVHM